MDARWSTLAEKHFDVQTSEETRISGGPTNIARCNQYFESHIITTTHYNEIGMYASASLCEYVCMCLYFFRNKK